MHLEARLQQLLDKADITDSKYAYIRAADACDPDRMVKRFTEDCVASYEKGIFIEGREAIRAWYATRVAPVVASSHHVSNIEIAFADPDTAMLRCYLFSWQRFADHPATQDRRRFCRYLDTWVRRDGGWLQSSLICLAAGEFGSGDGLRFGEYLGWDG